MSDGETPTAAVSAPGATRGVDYAAFGVDLFQRLADAAPDQNVIVSPLSAGLALSLLANGATGGTLAGIQQVLATGLPLDAINAANTAMTSALRTDGVELAVASSLWARLGTPLLPSFVEWSRRLYGAQAAAVDFSAEAAVRQINDWVMDQTDGRITEMVTHPIDPNVILYLLNAVYFRGAGRTSSAPRIRATAPSRLRPARWNGR